MLRYKNYFKLNISIFGIIFFLLIQSIVGGILFGIIKYVNTDNKFYGTWYFLDNDGPDNIDLNIHKNGKYEYIYSSLKPDLNIVDYDSMKEVGEYLTIRRNKLFCIPAPEISDLSDVTFIYTSLYGKNILTSQKFDKRKVERLRLVARYAYYRKKSDKKYVIDKIDALAYSELTDVRLGIVGTWKATARQDMSLYGTVARDMTKEESEAEKEISDIEISFSKNGTYRYSDIFNTESGRYKLEYNKDHDDYYYYTLFLDSNIKWDIILYDDYMELSFEDDYDNILRSFERL